MRRSLDTRPITTARRPATEESPPSAAPKLTDAEIADRIRDYQTTGDERAITAVVTQILAQEERFAFRRAQGRIDPSDVVSALNLAIFSAIQRFDPDKGIPFGAFFRSHRSASIDEETAALGNAAFMSRKAWNDRGNVVKAVRAVQADQAKGSATTGPAAPHASSESRRGQGQPFELSPAFTDQDVATLSSRDANARRGALARLVGEVDAYLMSVLPASIATDARNRASADRVLQLLKGPLPTSRVAIEQVLQPKLRYVVEFGVRRGALPSPQNASLSDAFYAEVAKRADTSPEQAKSLHESYRTVVSMDADSSQTNQSGKGSALAERLSSTEDGEAADRLLHIAALLPFARAGSRTAFVLHTGLDGDRALPLEELGALLGLTTVQAETAVRSARTTLQHEAVADLLYSQSPAELTRSAATEDMAAVLAERAGPSPAVAAAPVRSARPGRRRDAIGQFDLTLAAEAAANAHPNVPEAAPTAPARVTAVSSPVPTGSATEVSPSACVTSMDPGLDEAAAPKRAATPAHAGQSSLF